jgi:hypothetical protein
MQAAESITTMAAKAAPPVAVASAQAVGITLPEAVQLAALFYTILMIVHKLWHMWKEWRTGKAMPVSDGELP